MQHCDQKQFSFWHFLKRPLNKIFMENEDHLILSHLIGCKIIESQHRDEILPDFPPDVSSSVVINLISIYNHDGDEPKPKSTFRIDWMLQVIAYSFTLNMLYEETVSHSLSISFQWLLNDEIFKENQEWNEYASRIFRYQSLIFQILDEEDQVCVNSRSILIESWLKEINKLCNQCCSRFDNDTWKSLLRILIGCIDYLLVSKDGEIYAKNLGFKKYNDFIDQILSSFFKILFSSKITSTDLWNDYFEFSKKWLSQDIYANKCGSILISLYVKIMKSFDSNQDLNESDDFKLLGFHLYQMINIVFKDSRINEQMSKIIERLIEYSYKITYKKDLLHIPKYPGDVFFGLFGKWIFDPLNNSQCNEKILLIPSFSKIIQKFLISDIWESNILSSIEKLLNCNDSSIKFSMMYYGHRIINRFVSISVAEQFIHSIYNFNSINVRKIEYWRSCSILLLSLNELKMLDPKVLKSIIKDSHDVNSKLDIIYILLQQDDQELIYLCREICVKALEMDVDLGENKKSVIIDLLTMLSIVIAGSLPYHNIQGIDQLLLDLISCAKKALHMHEFVRSVIILIYQYGYWTDCIFNIPLYKEIFDFVNTLPEYLKHVVNLLCGRAITRSYQAERNKNLSSFSLTGNMKEDTEAKDVIASFLLGDSALISINGDKIRKDSFEFSIRDSRGMFKWKLEDMIKSSNIYRSEKEINLNYQNMVPINLIPYHNRIRIEGSEGINKKIEETKCFDDFYSQCSKYYEQNYLSINNIELKDGIYQNNQIKIRMRHKFIDFILQTGLDAIIRKPEEDTKEIIDKYDSIDEVTIYEIPVLLYNLDGCTNSMSPLFSRFLASIGSSFIFKNISENPIPGVHMGSIVLAFNPGGISKDVGVVFNEAPLPLNISHESMPKFDLLIIVSTIDSTYYKVKCFCRHSLYWSSCLHSRIVAVEHIQQVLSNSIFYYIALNQHEILFSKNQERSNFLASIPTKPISLLDISKSLSIDDL